MRKKLANFHMATIVSIVCSVFIAIVLLASCAPKKPVAEEPKVIKMGAHSSLTGTFSLYGLPMKQAIQMAADQINAKGGINIKGNNYRIELIWEDNKSTGEGGIAAVQKLVTQDKVQFLIGTITDCSVASAPIAEANKIVYFSGAGGPDFIAPANKHCFTYGITTSMWYFVYACRLPELFPDKKSIAYLSFDTGFGRDGGKWVKAGVSVSGLQLVAEEYFPADTTEFEPYVTRILAKKPDIVFINASRAGAPQIAKVLRTQGLKGLIAGSSQFEPSTALKVLSQAEAEGIIDGLDPVKGKVPYVSPDLAEAISAYEAAHPGEPKILKATAFMGIQVQILAEAIKAAQSLKSDDVIAVLLSGRQFDTWYGPVGFAGGGLYPTNRAAFWRFPISQIQSGELVGIDIVATDQLLKYMSKVK